MAGSLRPRTDGGWSGPREQHFATIDGTGRTQVFRLVGGSSISPGENVQKYRCLLLGPGEVVQDKIVEGPVCCRTSSQALPQVELRPKVGTVPTVQQAGTEEVCIVPSASDSSE